MPVKVGLGMSYPTHNSFTKIKLEGADIINNLYPLNIRENVNLRRQGGASDR